MDIAITKNKKHSISLVMPVSILFMTIILSLVSVDKTSICFVLPILLASFCSGYLYLGSYFLGVLVTLLFIENGLLTLYVSLTTFLVLLILNHLHFIKTRYLPFFVTGILMIYLYLFQMTYVQIGVLGVINFVNCYLYLELVPIFIHNKLDVYTNQRFMIISMIVLTMMLSLLPLNLTYMLILMRFYLLISIFYLSIHTIMPALMYVSIIMILMNPLLKDEILSMILPLSVFFMYQPKNKSLFTSIYLLGHVILPFFITYDYVYYAFVIVVSAFLFLIAPKIKVKTLEISQGFKDKTTQHQLACKADSFAALFNQLTDVFKDNHRQTNVSEYIGYVYEDVCSHCSSRNYCFYSKDGVSRLGKLMTKGMKEDYSDEDIQYIHSYCINPDQYVDSVQSYKDSYLKMLRVEHANEHMKKDLFNEFALISDVFRQFSQSVENEHDDEYCLREHLLAYQFQVVYLKKNKMQMGTYTLELGIEDIDRQIVEEELIPILETYLDQNLQIVSLQDNHHCLGYTSIVLKHELQYNIQYGYQQFSLDRLDCGDSYISFEHLQHHYIALSDGMGQGHLAAKESKLTLDILSKLIMNGIGLTDTLNAINALLKIKNQGDMYTTLDLCDINLVSARLKMIKYGAYPSFIIRDQQVEMITTKSLPVGMSGKIKMTSYDMKLKENDLIILASDGVGERFSRIVDENKEQYDSMHPSEIATLLMGKVLIKDHLDDMSIIVLKIVKRK